MIKAYKLLRQRKDGSFGPLFINARLRIPFNVWMEAEDHPMFSPCDPGINYVKRVDVFFEEEI